MSDTNTHDGKIGFPVVKGIVGKMRFRPLPQKLGRSNFKSDLSWDEISNKIIEYFTQKRITYLPSYATSAFTITSSPKDSRLNMDIIAYLAEDGTFVIEFKRICGDLFTAADIFSDLKILLHDKLSFEDLLIRNEENARLRHNNDLNGEDEEEGEDNCNFDDLLK